MKKDQFFRNWRWRNLCMIFLYPGLLMLSVSGFAQDRSIPGVVTGADGVPLEGASVSVKGMNKNTQTDAQGKFIISARTGQTLSLSYVGYVSKEVIIGDENTLQISMSPADNKLLEDVVVVGYGTQRKANLTGAVATVDVNKAFGSRPINDPTRALQGISPGLNIQFGNGGLTSAASVNIRGIGSLNGSNRALILVDNVETSDLSVVNPNDIESISVLKDAASTSIYGARAAFGVVLIKTKSGRKDQKMKVTYNNYFSANTPTILPDFSDPVPELKGLNEAGLRGGTSSPETFGMNLVKLRDGIINWKAKFAGKNGNEMVKGEDWNIESDGRAYFYKVWDPKKEMLNKYTFSQQHNISIEGGTDKITYFLSGGYNYDGGIFKMNPDRVNKYNVTVGLNASPSKWLDVSVRALNRSFSYDFPYSYQDYWYYFWRWGSYFPYGTYQGNYFRTNSAYMAAASKSNVTSNYQRLDLGATLKISPKLNIRAEYNIVRDNALRHETGGPVIAWDFWSAGTLAAPNIATAAQDFTSYTNGRLLMNIFNTYATYQDKFAGNHNIKVTAGINAEKDETINYLTSKRGLLDASQGEFSTTYGDATVTGAPSTVDGWRTNGHGKRAYAGYFGRINYDYKGKYLLELNGRYDGSSSFPGQERWVFFPSASVGYRISEESFMESVKSTLSDVKIRASYGELGNQDLGSALYLPAMSGVNVNWITPTGTAYTPTVYQPRYANNNLQWETVKMLDFGADLRLFNNHIGVTFDWYERKNQGLVQTATVPATFGVSGPYINAGTLRTRGYEISIDANYSINRELQLYGSASFWDYKSVITQWDNPNQIITQNYKGKTYGEIIGFETQGFWTAQDDPALIVKAQKGLQSGNFVFGAGDIRYKDQNGDTVINGGNLTPANPGDLKSIGNTQPRYQYNFRAGGTWKNFDLDVFFQGVGKREWWGVGNVALPMYQGLDILYANQLDYWTPENPNAKYPRLFAGNTTSVIAGLGNPANTSTAVIPASGNNFYPQTKYMLNLAYCRLKSLTIGYTLPQSVLNRISIQKLRFFLSGQNLAEISNVGAPLDPELTDGSNTSNYTGRTWPFNRSYAFGLQLTF